MPLTKLTLSLTLQWTLQKLLTGRQPIAQGPDTYTFDLSGVSLTTFDQIDPLTLSLGAGTNQDVDFYAFTNLVNEATGFRHALSLLVIAQPVAGAVLTVKPGGGSNPLTWFFTGTTPGISLPADAGALLVVSLGATATGQVVDATHRNLNFGNSGTGTLPVNLAVVGGST